MLNDIFTMEKLKLVVWSSSAGIIASFFYVTTFLSWANILNTGDSVLFISPLMCGLILGIVTSEQETINTVIGTIILAIVATLCVALTLFFPFITGVVSDPGGLYSFIYIPQNMMLTLILVLPLSLLGSFTGRMFAESILQSSSIKREKDALRSETEEWYRMLEEKLEEKRAALEKMERERNPKILNPVDSTTPVAQAKESPPPDEIYPEQK